VRIPADSTHVALIRAAASALAVRLDFPIDRITELQIVVDEVSARLLAVSQDPGHIVIRFTLPGDGSIKVRARVDGPRRKDRELLSDWSRVILEAIATDLRPELGDGTTALSLRVTSARR